MLTVTLAVTVTVPPDALEPDSVVDEGALDDSPDEEVPLAVVLVTPMGPVSVVADAAAEVAEA